MALGHRPLASAPLAGQRPAAGGNVTGTLAATEGAALAAFVGVQSFIGTLAATEAADAAAFAGLVTESVTGTLAATDGADSAAFVGIGGTTVSTGAGAPGSARRKRPRTLVEIDGETYEVANVEEARQLLAQKKQALLDAAPRAAKTALNKARDVERKTGALPALTVEVPAIEVADDASATMRALAERAQRSVNDAYVRATQDAELALLSRRAYMAQDEEDAMAVLLLS